MPNGKQRRLGEVSEPEEDAEHDDARPPAASARDSDAHAGDGEHDRGDAHVRRHDPDADPADGDDGEERVDEHPPRRCR